MVRSRTCSYYRTMVYNATLQYIRMTTAFRGTFVREDGASMVEYALLVALIAMVAIGAVALVGTALNDQYNSIASSVAEA